ncbi:hypothetical protein [Streptomyces sp. NPDC058657]|uniref:hypothetical protein n=1 Tax=unclassified Streptomyces TaxID=2593676 RepID=UPI00365ABB55
MTRGQAPTAQRTGYHSAALYLLPSVLERLTSRQPGIEPEVRIVRELGAGTAGEIAEGRAEPAPSVCVRALIRELRAVCR